MRTEILSDITSKDCKRTKRKLEHLTGRKDWP